MTKLINMTNLVALALTTIVLASSGCGFHLQNKNARNNNVLDQQNFHKKVNNELGKPKETHNVKNTIQVKGNTSYSTNNNIYANILEPTVLINTSGGESSRLFQRNLISKLKNNGIKATINQPRDLHAGDNNKTNNIIELSDISFREYNLMGVLTEVRMVLLADINYSYITNGEIQKHSQNFQIQHNYQYNKASISTNSQQKSIIQNWLYDELAERISSQYSILTQRNN